MAGRKFGQAFEAEMNLDKPRRLKIDFNTLCKVEEVTGQSCLKLDDRLTGVLLRAFIWAGLQYDDDETPLTLEEAGLLVGAYYVEVMTAFYDAWELAMPEPSSEFDGEDPENPLETATAPS